MTPAGLPHSDTPGSKPAGGSPGLFAAHHVLHRPSAPRHPPRALINSSSTASHQASRIEPHTSTSAKSNLIYPYLTMHLLKGPRSWIIQDPHDRSPDHEALTLEEWWGKQVHALWSTSARQLTSRLARLPQWGEVIDLGVLSLFPKEEANRP